MLKNFCNIHTCSKRGGGFKGRLNNVKKNCTIGDGWLPLLMDLMFVHWRLLLLQGKKLSNQKYLLRLRARLHFLPLGLHFLQMTSLFANVLHFLLMWLGFLKANLLDGLRLRKCTKFKICRFHVTCIFVSYCDCNFVMILGFIFLV